MTIRAHNLIAGGVFAFSLASAAHAQHAGDILLSIDNNTIYTGHIENSGSLTAHERVFGTTLGITFPSFTDSPGYDCLPSTFPVPSRNGFRILDALRIWDGADFHLIPEERMLVEFSTFAVETPAAPSVVEGFTLAVGSNGEWHRHLEYTLESPADPGIYLLNLQIYSTAGLSPTPPFWIVFNQNRPVAELNAAAEWVKRNLAGEGCGTADFNGDGDVGTDADIEAFFRCLAGTCCPTCFTADFNADGDTGTDADIEAFFRVLAGGSC